MTITDVGDGRNTTKPAKWESHERGCGCHFARGAPRCSHRYANVSATGRSGTRTVCCQHHPSIGSVLYARRNGPLAAQSVRRLGWAHTSITPLPQVIHATMPLMKLKPPSWNVRTLGQRTRCLLPAEACRFYAMVRYYATMQQQAKNNRAARNETKLPQDS